ncbi:MAG: hypothetical protein PW786_01225 [Arachidicoccus sp.]|nr:hypothetical protein [Arachidicoccus sp.]
MGKENQTTFSYNFNQQVANIMQVFGGQVLSGYRNYSAYQTPLLTGNSQTWDAGFDFKKTLWALFANIDLSYSRNKNYFMDSSVISKNTTTVIAVPIDNYSDNISLGGNASKYFYSLNTTLAIGANFTRSGAQQMQNAQLFSTHNNVMKYSASITPTIFDWLDIKFSGSYTKNTSSSNAEGYIKQFNSQWNENSSIIFYPLKNLIIDIDNQYLKSIHQGENLSSAFLMNGYIRYNFQNPKLHKLQLQLSCNNLKNVRNYEIINVSSNITSVNRYLLQPRMLLLSAHFDL